MDNVLSLALPFFALILIGYLSAKFWRIPVEGLGWLNIFIVYVSLPALLFQLMAKTPIEQLANWAFIAATTLSTYVAFTIAFAVGVIASRGDVRAATIQGLAGAYSNVGYMGPGLTLAALGPTAAVPTALILCFDNALLFVLIPILMALGTDEPQSPLRMIGTILGRILRNPLIMSTVAGIAAAALGVRPPLVVEKILNYLTGAAAPCALYALGVTVALQPLKRIPREMPVLLFIKLVLHPVLVFALLDFWGGFDPVWLSTAVLMAALPPALNVFVVAQQHQTYVERASSLVLIGTGLSVVSVTGFLYVVTHDLLPVGTFRR